VEVRRQIDDKERTIRTPGQGDLLGEVARFRHGPSATAVAVEHVTLLAIHAPRLEQIVQTNPELVIALIRQLARMAAMAISAAERSR
jgi:CRP-like cAMP-binding protein